MIRTSPNLRRRLCAPEARSFVSVSRDARLDLIRSIRASSPPPPRHTLAPSIIILSSSHLKTRIDRYRAVSPLAEVSPLNRSNLRAVETRDLASRIASHWCPADARREEGRGARTKRRACIKNPRLIARASHLYRILHRRLRRTRRAHRASAGHGEQVNLLTLAPGAVSLARGEEDAANEIRNPRQFVRKRHLSLYSPVIVHRRPSRSSSVSSSSSSRRALHSHLGPSSIAVGGAVSRRARAPCRSSRLRARALFSFASLRLARRSPPRRARRRRARQSRRARERTPTTTRRVDILRLRHVGSIDKGRRSHRIVEYGLPPSVCVYHQRTDRSIDIE